MDGVGVPDKKYRGFCQLLFADFFVDSLALKNRIVLHDSPLHELIFPCKKILSFFLFLQLLNSFEMLLCQ
jgi:hypothetical protein